jgi:putative membrane protein
LRGGTRQLRYLIFRTHVLAKCTETIEQKRPGCDCKSTLDEYETEDLEKIQSNYEKVIGEMFWGFRKGEAMKTPHLHLVLGVWICFLVLMGTIHCGNGYQHMGPWGAGPWHMMAYGYGGLFMWILFLVVLAIVVYFVMQSTRSRSLGGASQETPMDILKKRYARGEITKEEFEGMKKDLEG